MSHDKTKILKKWSVVLESLGVKDTEKKDWMAEYAENHQIFENVAYSTLNNLNGMGAISAPQPGSPGNVWGYTTGQAGTKGSGDIAQNLLPVSMKIAAHTIGLDLVAVKPTSSPRIEMIFVDFKYDNNDGDPSKDQYDKPLVFKVGGIDAVSYAAIKTAIANLGVKETMGGLSQRVWFKLSGGTSDAFYATGTAYTSSLVEPTNKQGWLEFLGFSRVDGQPIFRNYRQSAVPSAAFTYNAVKNTFDNLPNLSVLNIIGDGATALIISNTVNFVFGTGIAINLVSTFEDHIPGFVAAWNDKLPMQREVDEKTYPSVIAPDLFSKSVQVGDIEISSALKRTQIEDIKASTGMDIVQKMESVLINELTQTISKQIVNKIKELANVNAASYSVPKAANGVDTAFDYNVDDYIGSTGFGPAPGGETYHSIQRKLIAKIRHASNFIAVDGRVGPAQYLITNFTLASVIQDIANYVVAPVEVSKMNTNGQVYPIGSIGNIQIYVDPYMRGEDKTIYLGRKNSVDQPGLVFVPYLMAQQISLISEATFAPRMLIRSRYAIVDLGFFPHKQFMTIKVTDNNGVLI
jgi:hypothetical protein